MTKRHLTARCLLALAIALVVNMTGRTAAADENGAAEHAIRLGDGKVTLVAPQGWVRKKPKFNMIDHEFSVAAAKGDAADGRVVVMGAGGSVQDNIDRWI